MRNSFSLNNCLSSKELKLLTKKEKELYIKGYCSALDGVNIPSFEKEIRKFCFKTYINLYGTNN